MRLHVAVREGDHVDTSYQPVGATVARHMTDLGEFDVHEFGGRDYEATDARWQRLDSAMLAATCPVDVGPDTPVTELTDLALQAVRAAGLAVADTEPFTGFFGENTSVHVWLTDPATDEHVDPAGTVAEAGLADGDLVVLCVENQPPGLYRLLPAPTPELLFSRLVLSERLAGSKDEPTVHGVLLYTDADVEVATFVRTHFDELNALTGTLLRIFVMERPSDWGTAKRYWRPHLEPQLYRSLAALRWLRWIPYDRSRVYEVAHELGVPVDALPCLVLFADHTEDRALVFPLDGLTIAGVRRLVREIAEAVGTDGARYEMDDDHGTAHGAWRAQLRKAAGGEPAGTGEAFERLLLAERRLHAAVRPAPAAPQEFRFHDHTVFVHIGGRVSDQFNFHGQTTFINRPVNTVITDFQNAHGEGAAQKQLAELLRLVLSSSDLADADRERVAELVDAAASEAAADEPEPGKVQGILETIKTTVSTASDIAGPAIGIVAKVLELLS